MNMNIDTNFRYVRVEELETIHAAIERAIPVVLDSITNTDDLEQIDEDNALLVDLKTASEFVSQMLKRPE